MNSSFADNRLSGPSPAGELINQKIFFYFNLIYFMVCSISFILLMKECHSYLGIIYANFISTILFYSFEFKSAVFDVNYFIEEKYKTLLRIIQVINFIFNLISTIYFFGKDKICYSESDQNLNLFFYFFTWSIIILNQIFIKKYNVGNISQIVPIIELKNMSNLKGVVKKEKIKECAICLEEEKKIEVEVIVLNCTHVFHYTCINDCYENNIKKCPLCRVEYIL